MDETMRDNEETRESAPSIAPPSTSYSAEKIDALEKTYGEGLTSIGKLMLPRITALAEDLSLPSEKIKSWIGNRNRKRRRHYYKATDKDLEGQNLTPYQVFQKMYHRPDASLTASSSLAQINFETGVAWRAASAEQKEKCQALSIMSKATSELSKEGIQNLIYKKLDKISITLTELNNLWCAAVCVAQTDPKEFVKVTKVHNSLGEAFSPNMAMEFILYLQKQSSDQPEWTNGNVKQLFADKWAEFGCNRLNYNDYKTEYDVIGMPPGIPFHRHQDYGKFQIPKIMACRESIKFIML